MLNMYSEDDAKKEPKRVPRGSPNLICWSKKRYKTWYKLTTQFGSDFEANLHDFFDWTINGKWALACMPDPKCDFRLFEKVYFVHAANIENCALAYTTNPFLWFCVFRKNSSKQNNVCFENFILRCKNAHFDWQRLPKWWKWPVLGLPGF